MTDRYYPGFPPSAQGVWKTTYELQNEMRSFQRSAYPPGYAGHEPGVREKFGYSCPGPDASRLSHSDLALTEDADIHEPRRIQAVPRVQEPDDRVTFEQYDLPAASRSGPVPWADGADMQKSLPRVRSLPALQRKPPPPPLRQARDSIDSLEDQRFTYFVPANLQKKGQKELSRRRPTLSRLEKADRVVLSLDGGGTGFKTQCQLIGWDPAASKMAPVPVLANNTMYRTEFSPPPFFRMSHKKDLSLAATTC